MSLRSGPKEDEPSRERYQQGQAWIDEYRGANVFGDSESDENWMGGECQGDPDNDAQHPAREKGPIDIENRVASHEYRQ